MPLNEEDEAKKIEIEKATQAALSETAVWFGEFLSARAKGVDAETFMLTSAASLTVRADGNYGKAAHTGGEDFRVIRGYQGKRDGLILVFEPVMASAYTEMEMPLTVAVKELSGFDAVVKEAELDKRIESISHAKLKAREELANAERQTAYGKDYGGW